MARVCALLVALAAPVAAAAQPSWSSAVDSVRETARAHVGPFYATPTLQLKEVGVDGNVFNADGDPRSDFTFTVAPKADIWIPVSRRALVKATAGTDLVWYAQYATERSIDPQLNLRGELYLHRLMLFGEGAYLNTRQRPNHEIDLRSRHLEGGLKAGVGYEVTPRFSIEVAGNDFTTRYDADSTFDGTSLQHTLNRDTRGVEITGRQRLTPLTSVAVRYDNVRDTFMFSPLRDSVSYRVMPGIEFKPRALVNGSAYVGYRQFTPTASAAFQEFSGPVAELGLSYTLLGATTFGVSYRRDLTYSYEELQPFFVDGSVGVSVRRAIGRRFDALVSADRHTYDYHEVLTGNVSSAPRIDVTWTYAASAGYRLGRHGRVAFGASYWLRESTTEQFRDYENLRIGTSMSFGL